MTITERPFREQFIRCGKEGFTGEGKFIKWRDNIELFPHPIFNNKAAKNLMKLLDKNPDAGFNKVACLRFSGDCCSSNKECIKFRRYISYKKT